MPFEKISKHRNSKEYVKFADLLINLYHQINKDLDRILEVADRKRNFQIVVNRDEHNIVINLIKKNKVLNLNDFLPENVSFKEGLSFEYERYKDKGFVYFNPDHLPLRTFLLSLFHEIGHSNFKNRLSLFEGLINVKDKLLVTCQLVLNLYIGFLKRFFQSNADRIEDNVDFLEYLLDASKEGDALIDEALIKFIRSLLPAWYKNKEAIALAVQERNAWSYALKTLRRLNKDGFNVFASFDSFDEIKLYIFYCLLTHDLKFMLNQINFKANIDLKKKLPFSRRYPKDVFNDYE